MAKAPPMEQISATEAGPGVAPCEADHRETGTKFVHQRASCLAGQSSARMEAPNEGPFMRNFPYTGHGSLRHPEVVDVDCRVVDATPAKADLSVPIFRFLTVTPCLLSMLGGVLDLWSGPASMIGAS